MRAVALLVWGLSLSSARAETPLTVAIFAPNAPFESGTDRFAFATKMAQQLASAGVAPTPKVFAHASDFEAAIQKHQVDFALVDGVYLAAKGRAFGVLGTASFRGEMAPHWALYSGTASSVHDLAGKKLTLVWAGTHDAAFLDNALFESELSVSHFFSQVKSAPDVHSAVAAAALKKTDAVFAPEGSGQGLRRVFEAGRIPNAAFCQVQKALAPALVARVKTAMLAMAAVGDFDGFRSSSNDPYRLLGLRMKPHPKRPVMAEPETIFLDGDVLLPPAFDPAWVDAKELYDSGDSAAVRAQVIGGALSAPSAMY